MASEKLVITMGFILSMIPILLLSSMFNDVRIEENKYYLSTCETVVHRVDSVEPRQGRRRRSKIGSLARYRGSAVVVVPLNVRSRVVVTGVVTVNECDGRFGGTKRPVSFDLSPTSR